VVRRLETSRIRALDGLRGVALVAVLGYHSLPGTVRGGFLGVDVFFVLSGFLLGSLLLAEHERTGAIDHRRYAARRVRRLLPAGAVVLLAVAVLGPHLAPDSAWRLRGDVLSSAAGLTNWRLIAQGASYFATTGRPPLVRHFWSLAVEAQFYVVCPLVVAWIARHGRRAAVAALSGGIGVSALMMWILYRPLDPYRAYYGTDTRIGALLAGVLLALLVRREDIRRALAGLAGPAFAVVALLVFVADARSRLLYPEGFLLTQAATMAIIAAALGGGVTATALRARPLRWLGERSYGIYLWHWPLVALLRPRIDVPWSPPAAAVVTVTGACILGALSFRYIEQPLLRARPARSPLVRRHRLVAAWSAGGAALVVLTAFTVHSPAADPIAASLQAGERVLAAQNPAASFPAADGAVDADGVKPATVPVSASPAASATPRPAAVRVTAIGDSVMLGAAGALHARLGAASFIDAAKKRQFSDAVTVIRTLRARGRLGKTVILHLGNNGPPRSGEIEALVRELRDVPRIVFVSVRVDKDWQDTVNAALRSGTRGSSAASVADWYAYSNGHRDWFWSDGTHLREQGAEEYARFVASALAPPPTPGHGPAAKASPAPAPSPTPALRLPLP
jgi:peptidoglycan/LPS O-acetylase OafA/YrhL